MRDLWGDEQPHQTKRPTQATKQSLISLTAQDCLLYGHSFTPAGMSGEKLCTSCGLKGYCPVCTPLNTSPDATAFLCTRHSHGSMQA
jgi:hypothetical protein